MVAPLVGLAIGAAARAAIKKAATKKLIKEAAKKKPLATPKSAVKVLPRKTAPKTDLSGRGAKLTPKEQARRASDLDFGKMEQRFDSLTEMRSTGLVSSKKGLVAARGPGKNNQRKADAIKKEAKKVNIYEATKKPPIKINSAPRKTAAKPGTKRK
jgi:hypothetical protein